MNKKNLSVFFKFRITLAFDLVFEMNIINTLYTFFSKNQINLDFRLICSYFVLETTVNEQKRLPVNGKRLEYEGSISLVRKC